MDSFAQSKLLYSPPSPRFTRVEALRRYINQKHNLALRDYNDLHEYSVTDYTFWLDLWQFMGIIYSAPPTQVFTDGYIKEVKTWFPGALLNYAENMLWRNDDGIAITASGELGNTVSCSFRELRLKVQDMTAALRVKGLKAGDRVAAIVANNIDAVVIALATAAVGGIFSSTATDLGTQGILDRYRQITPKFIFSATEVVYAAKRIDLLSKVSDVVRDLHSHGLEHVVLLPSTRTGKEVDDSALKGIPNSTTLSRFLADGDGRPLTFEQLPFSHPLYILYSSGTTGAPKCIVHSAGASLLQPKKELLIQSDLGSDSTYFQYTTTGWMMWPFMLAGLSVGARIVLYDGSPFHPDVKAYLKFINDEGVTAFGTSPRFLAEIQGRGVIPTDIGTFEALRVVSVTGAVLTTPLFEWAHRAFGGTKRISSTSGGTDVMTSFVTTVACLPTHAGEIQGKALGMKVEIFDPSGKNIENSGQPGELVCTRPHPSMPIKFWGDDAQGTKFLRSYFDVYPGVWRHGDFIAKNPRTGGLIIYGRSDGVLNPSGVRFGSGEIYSVMERFSSVIDDTICVGQRRAQDVDERVLLFVKMRPGHALTPALEREIREAIRKALSARHVPAYIFAVEDIPYTVNSKKIEIAVKQIVSGSKIKPSGTVANPESLQLYYKFQDIENVGKTKAKL
ncbi:acetoacetate-CoA ligase [Dentipellis sp. KUC8613]|nr:acetoacetate-CoA ligase [Dentipellis sp. KUC8613]